MGNPAGLGIKHPEQCAVTPDMYAECREKPGPAYIMYMPWWRGPSLWNAPPGYAWQPATDYTAGGWVRV